MEYSPTPTDDLFRFWSSKVKDEGHNMVAKASASTVHLLVTLVNGRNSKSR